jgi:hypothetical protein
MHTLQQTILTNWHFMRWLRLAIGLYAITEAVKMQDYAIGFLGGIFLLQAITNTGCCGTKSCSTSAQNNSYGKQLNETTFEEIKTTNHGNN